jgi:hypothetical protein
MALYNTKTKSTYSFNQGSWAPSGNDWKWKYTGDIVDRHMWRMKKEAQKEQEMLNVLNKYSAKVKNKEITADDIVNMVNNHTVPEEDVKSLGSALNLACFGVYDGYTWKDVIGKDGWPTLEYVYRYIHDNLNYRDGGDIEACYRDENNMQPEEIYIMLDSGIYQNNLGKADARYGY